MYRSVGFTAALLLFHACEADGQEPVVSLTSSSFEHATQAATGQTTGTWLVLFTAPEGLGCPNCAEVERVWENVAVTLQEQRSPVISAKVDVTQSQQLFERFSLAQTPTILLFRDRQMFTYYGRPTAAEAIIAFATSEFAQAKGAPVPKPPSAVDVLVRRVQDYIAENMTEDVQARLKLMRPIAMLMVLVTVAWISLEKAFAKQERQEQAVKKNE